MLINIDPILSPEILHTLRSMGHGDKLILSDSNFPAYSMNSRVHRLDGVDAARAAKAILSTPLSLGKLRGRWYEYKTLSLASPIDVLVSYHPAFLLRSPNYKKEAWNDLQMLQKKLNEN